MDGSPRNALCALALVAASLPAAATAAPEPPVETGPVLQLGLPVLTEWSFGVIGPVFRPVFLGARLQNATVGVGLGLGSGSDDQESLGFGKSDRLVFDVIPSVALVVARARATEAYVLLGMPLQYGHYTFGTPDNERTYLGAGGSVGLGGTHFLSRNFGLGVEAEVSTVLTFGRYASEEWVSTGWSAALRGAITATLVL